MNKSNNPFWNDFDVEHASSEELTAYILKQKTFDESNVANRKHYLIYLIRNKLNGKIYVGQHSTDRIDDGYMGSGKILEFAKQKYGLENFERIVIFDFETFDEMNQMEIDIITNEFRHRYDIVYNRANGGFEGPNGEYQREMHKLGIWTSYNEGKTVYHTKDGDEKWFEKDETVPDGWIKGHFPTEEYLKFHEKIDGLMDELHALGSKKKWNVGDSEEMIRMWIAQRKKMNSEEEKKRELWRLIFDDYKKFGKVYIRKKYANVENIDGIKVMFAKYFRDEYLELKRARSDKQKFEQIERERMISELKKYGIERDWDEIMNRHLKMQYESFMRRKKYVDEQSEKYRKIFGEYVEYGLTEIMKRYNDTNIREKFIRYIPKDYKKYMFEKHGRVLDIDENCYSKLLRNGMKNRKKRVDGEQTIERRKQYHDERVRLFNELWATGSKRAYREDEALTTLRTAIAAAKRNQSNFRRWQEHYTAMYNDFVENGYDHMKEKFDYTGIRGNLKRRFKKYVVGYDESKLKGK